MMTISATYVDCQTLLYDTVTMHGVPCMTKGVILTVLGSVWFGSVRNRSDFDASGSVNRKRVYGSVRDQSHK